MSCKPYYYDTLHNERSIPDNFSIVSKNGIYEMKVQEDGNLVVYKYPGKTLWNTNNDKDNIGIGPYQTKLLNDGNLVLIDANNKLIWNSNSVNKGTSPYCAVIQNDGNFVIYDFYNTPIWATNTWQE